MGFLCGYYRIGQPRPYQLGGEAEVEVLQESGPANHSVSGNPGTAQVQEIAGPVEVGTEGSHVDRTTLPPHATDQTGRYPSRSVLHRDRDTPASCQGQG